MKFGWASRASPANQENCICVSPESSIWICQVGALSSVSSCLRRSNCFLSSCNGETNVKPQFDMRIAGFENGAAGVLQLGGIIEDISKARCLSGSPGQKLPLCCSCLATLASSISLSSLAELRNSFSSSEWNHRIPSSSDLRHHASARMRHGPLDAEADGPSRGLQMPPGLFAAPGRVMVKACSQEYHLDARRFIHILVHVCV